MKVLITETDYFGEDIQKMLQKLGKVKVIDTSMERLLESVEDIDILLIGLDLPIERKVIEKGKNLKAIGTPTTGIDHIDIKAAKEKNIKIISLKGEYDFLDKIHASFEHTMALMLTILRKIPYAFESVKNFSWERKKFVGYELKNKTIGILGYGRIGKKVANICLHFKMKVIANDINMEKIKDDGFEAVLKEELFKRSDIVVISVPLEENTINLVDKKEIFQMKDGSWIINTSRGRIINDYALLEALKSKKLAGAAVDVLSTENTASHPQSNKLIEYSRIHDNLVITPHIAGSTIESMRMTGRFIAEKVLKNFKK